MMSFKVLSLLLVSLSFVLMEENGTRDNTKNPRFLKRRYSEGTLASDYSRTLDNMLKKNFVEWLLNRRESRIDLEPSKREVKLPALQARNQGTEAGTQRTEAEEWMSCFLPNMGEQSLALPKSSDDWKDILRQEFLAWLISADLCRPMMHKD
ncbi:gastric inhibitory polypeptide isoform X3 [Sceloporus undulatus]|uniref:gastric inhibitory polypeptide isoform X3 n=1 Tax=Sceloporus undulatus TaxID=8520 RepID=UPI001C4D43F4|nr:gastric inhibitory polypeptide isoform X3 [Sceloporus undulatus]